MEGRLGILVVIAGLLFGQSSAWGAVSPKRTYTNKVRFRIPFESNSLKRSNVREVQLHVSQNQGDSWDLAQVLTPDGGKFEYVATAEGEYWFAIKTLDTQNQLRPPRGSYDTGLIVIVDTSNPILDLSLQQIDVGKVQARWRASDTHLEIDTLRLEYLAPGARDWALLDVAPRARGETSWILKQTGIVSVRGVISDTSGNVANTKVQLEVDAENYPALKQRAIPQGKIANKPHQEDTAGRANVDGSLSALPIPEPDDDDIGLRAGNRRTGSPVRSPDKYAMRQSPTQYEAGRSAIPARPVSTESLKPADRDEFDDLSADTTEDSPAHGSATSRRTRSMANKTVASHQFQVGYKINDVGPSGVAAVELFITEDNGSTWWKYGDDADLKSPFDVQVPRDGEFGFAIRVRSGAGLTTEPPAAGDAPELVIVVDQTPPAVELLPVGHGDGAKFNRLAIRWHVTEDHPADKSVSLYYSASRSGPWKLISDWQEDKNGEYEWGVGPGVPLQFYIRVLVRDAAGNQSSAETTEPIIVDQSRPTAQFLDVETRSGSGPK